MKVKVVSRSLIQLKGINDMCSKDYLRRLAGIVSAIVSLYTSKLNAIGKLNKMKSTSNQDVDEYNCAQMYSGIISDADKVLIYDVFRKILLIGLEKNWDDYNELLVSYLKGITGYPGLISTMMDPDTEKMYSTVMELLDKSQSPIAQDDRNTLISCRNILYKS